MKNKIILLFLCFSFFLVFNSKANADESIELKDEAKITDNTIVRSYNAADVYVDGNKIDIENFETTVDSKEIYRKYVSLDDIVKLIPTITYKEVSDKIISVDRKYDKQINGFDVYYDTEHDIDKKTFTSVLFVGEDDKILFGDTTRDEVLTADASTLKINGKIYVSLRFLTESLGAEVVYKYYSDTEMLDFEEGTKQERVTIDFYSNEKYGKVINMEWKNKSDSIVTLDNIKSSSKDECFTPNFSYKYREEGKNELKEINNTYSKIYLNNDNFKWNIDEKELCSNKEGDKLLDNSLIVVKYRGVPVILDINNLGISQYCKSEDLSLASNCDSIGCKDNPKCGIIQGNYYCCNDEVISHFSEFSESEKYNYCKSLNETSCKNSEVCTFEHNDLTEEDECIIKAEINWNE